MVEDNIRINYEKFPMLSFHFPDVGKSGLYYRRIEKGDLIFILRPPFLMIAIKNAYSLSLSIALKSTTFLRLAKIRSNSSFAPTTNLSKSRCPVPAGIK